MATPWALFKGLPSAHDRILKVARTLADLAGLDNITANQVIEAI